MNGLIAGGVSALLAALMLAAPARPASVTERAASDAVRGRVVIPDQGSPLGLYAYLTSAVHADSVAIDAAGEFSIPIGTGSCGPAELRIDTPAGEHRRYHRAVVHLAGAATQVRTPIPDELRVLLVPTHVAIDGGNYAGTVVPVDLDGAFSASAERVRFWRVTRSARQGYGTPVAWPETSFPIPVALRARGGVRSADSAAFWQAARQLEADFGRSLFEPVADDPGAEEIWRIVVAIESRTTHAAITFATYDVFGALYEATIAVRSTVLLRDASLVTHELMHALGFGHAGGWYSATGGPGVASPRATSTDVAHAQLLYRLRRAHVTQQATHGVMASATHNGAVVGSLVGPRRVTTAGRVRQDVVSFSGRASRCAP